MSCNRIELLAPAGNAAIGRAAIDAGADAVYIGGAMFSARAAAGNSLAEIGELCAYAHLFGAKVYLAINTLLENDELQAARAMVIEARKAGVDAFIVQDMAFLSMDLPTDIVLHASTQCSNRTAERVAELAAAGFSRVVLERGLNLRQISEICASTDVEIEAFVHGAICISYSGECYLSEALAGRSANRGECAQPCRSLYDLVDARGTVLLRNEPLLSPKDLNLSARLGELIVAGVSSLKIEGRLKDERYVANTVAYYNQKLTELGVERTSFGVSRPMFTPDPERTFTRGFTQYFFDGRTRDVLTHNAPKGKFMGTVSEVTDKYFRLDRPHDMGAGDGAVNQNGAGLRINRVENGRVFPLTTRGLLAGDRIYCNLFHSFRPRSVRKIEVEITLNDSQLELRDIYGHSFTLPLCLEKFDAAQNQAKARETLIKNLAKSGDTIFEVRGVTIELSRVPFVPIAAINELRRALFALYQLPRTIELRPEPVGDRLPENHPSAALLTTPLCPLYQYGMCLKEKKLELPLRLTNNGRSIAFEPNCGECRLQLRLDDQKI